MGQNKKGFVDASNKGTSGGPLRFAVGSIKYTSKVWDPIWLKH